uniref:Polysaccharide deacetylase n=1 Tax=Methanococcus maripaludis (strain C6 / ATCC BAA-1332) TaxID=444158 RepID=A9AA29_METM6
METLIFFTLILILSANFARYSFEDNSEDKEENLFEPIILIHDVSPVYLEDLKEIDEVISKYGYSKRTYLFLIVNHANDNPLEKNQDFVKYIRYLQTKGYNIELHGYDHIEREFDCNYSIAMEKIEKSLEILNTYKIDGISCILPPRYGISEDSKKTMLENGFSVIIGQYAFEMNNGKTYKYNITNNEYTWYLEENTTSNQLNLAKEEYLESEYKYFLSIHPKAVNYGGGIEFLDEFLNFTKEENRFKSEDPINIYSYFGIKKIDFS